MQRFVQSTCRLRFTYWTIKGTDNDLFEKGSFFISVPSLTRPVCPKQPSPPMHTHQQRSFSKLTTLLFAIHYQLMTQILNCFFSDGALSTSLFIFYSSLRSPPFIITGRGKERIRPKLSQKQTSPRLESWGSLDEVYYPMARQR